MENPLPHTSQERATVTNLFKTGMETGRTPENSLKS
jgi:hypothetical protein